MMDLESLTEQVKDVALTAGAFLLDQRSHFHRERVESKRAHDYVSYVDKQSEKLIVNQLRDILPEAGFIAEEGTGRLQAEPYCWLVDPLDGTTNFIHNNAPYCVSIALRDKTRVLLGVVYECTRDELFWANQNSEAYLNDDVIHVSDIDDLDRAFIQLGFPYDAERYRSCALQLIDHLYGRVGGLRLMGSAAAETCYLAAGRFEARIEAFLGPWDIGAGSIILQQAGGKTTDFDGGEGWMDGSRVLSTNGTLHDQLLTIIQECRKGTPVESFL